MRIVPLTRSLLLAVVACGAVATAHAENADHATWSVDGTLTATSDYVWRGVSQTQGHPALQLEAMLTHASGFYAGAAASNVDFTSAQEEPDGIRYELSPFVGWSGAVGENAELDVFVSRVMYPGHKPDYNYNYNEIEGKLTFAERYHVGVAYSPNIFNLGGRGIYYNAGATLPLGDSGVSFKGQLGHYDLQRAAGDSYNDVRVSVVKEWDAFNAELAYTNTFSYGEKLSENLDDAKQADGRVVLSVGWAF